MRKLLLGAMGRPGFRCVLAGVVAVSIPAATIIGERAAASTDVIFVYARHIAKPEPRGKANKPTPKYLDLRFYEYQKGGPATWWPTVTLSKSTPLYCKPTPKHLDIRSADCAKVQLAERSMAWKSTNEMVAENSPETIRSISAAIISIQRHPNPPRGGALWTVRSRYDALIQLVAQSHDVDPALVKAIVQAESAFDPRAVSSAGARGLMQVLPETASLFAIENLFDPHQNLKAGVKYLKYLLEFFDHDVTMAVAAYNAGPNTVIRYRGVPPYNETQTYLVKVLELRDAYADESQRS